MPPLSESSVLAPRLRAPRETNRCLVVPSGDDIRVGLAENQVALAAATARIAGMPLPDLANLARTELVQAAYSHTCRYRSFDGWNVEGGCGPLILSGHQPELFHPGVWFKNFLLDKLAARYEAVPIQLIIDNDVSHAPVVRVPEGPIETPAVATVAYDADQPGLPYEELPLVDRDLFRTFSQRVTQAISPLVAEPLIERLWPHMQLAADRSNKLGAILAEGRHRYEGSLGLHTLEVPWSTVCDTRSFRRFFIHLLWELPTFHALYNESVLDYRRLHRLRSHSHPVPLLRCKGEWWETPFWVWSTTAPQRRPLWVRFTPSQWTFRDAAPDEANGNDIVGTIDTSRDHVDFILDQLDELRHTGIKIRSRALITTMYARTVLSDLFIHGIGGAVYDQLTDRFISDFLGLRPPTFVAATATMHLPIPKPAVDDDDLRRIDGLLRNLWYHPERYRDYAQPTVESKKSFTTKVEEKRAWLRMDTSEPQTRQMRHAALSRINEDLRAGLVTARQQLEQERLAVVRQLRARQLLGSREFSFVLFPEDELVSSLQRLR